MALLFLFRIIYTLQVLTSFCRANSTRCTAAATMKGMSRRFSRKSTKKKPPAVDIPKYAWQGEQVSALDGAIAGPLMPGDAGSASSADQVADRQYVRQKAVTSADMLTGIGQKNEKSPRRLHRIVSDSSRSGPPPAAGSTSPKASKLPMVLQPSTSDSIDEQTPVVEVPSKTFSPAKVVEPELDHPTVAENLETHEAKRAVSEDQETGMLDNSASEFSTTSVSASATPDVFISAGSIGSQEDTGADDKSETSSYVSVRSGRSNDTEALLRMVERVSQLERRNQQLALEVDQLNNDKKTVSEMAAIADDAVVKWKTAEGEFKEEIRSLREQLCSTEARLGTVTAKNEELSDQLAKSKGTSASLKQQLAAVGESLSRSSTPACPSPVPSHASATESAPSKQALAHLEEKTAEIQRLQEHCQTLEEEIRTQQEEAKAKIEQLTKDAQTAKTEQEFAERMRQRCQQQNQQLQRDKAELLASISTRSGSSSSEADTQAVGVTASAKQSIPIKQLESLLHFVSAQLPPVSEAPGRTSPSGIDVTRIRQQVLSAKQQLSVSSESMSTMSQVKKEAADLRNQLDSLQHAKAQLEAEVNSQQAAHEKVLLAQKEDLTALQSQHAQMCAERNQLQSRISEFEVRRRSSSTEIPTDDKQILSLRQEKAQLRVELRRAQNYDKTQKQKIAELTSAKEALEALLSQREPGDGKEEQSACSSCAKNAAENRQLVAELASLKDQYSNRMAEMSQLEAERNSLRQVNTTASRQSEQHLSELQGLQIQNTQLREECDRTSMQKMSLSAELDALRKSHQLAADETLRDEKEALERRVQRLKEEQKDRATVVRELKQQNEQLHEKLQHETKVGHACTDLSTPQETHWSIGLSCTCTPGGPCI